MNSDEYCKDCNWHLEHAYEAGVELDGKWREGPNGRMHFEEPTTPSKRYPTSRALYYLCGRRTDLENLKRLAEFDQRGG